MNFYDIVFAVGLRYWFPFNTFKRDVLTASEVCRKVYHCKIKVTFDIGNHPQNSGGVLAAFRLKVYCVLILVSTQ